MEALRVFTILTIGDGIVAAIPALVISVAGGIIATRAAAKLAGLFNDNFQTYASGVSDAVLAAGPSVVQ